jgi:ankyrin
MTVSQWCPAPFAPALCVAIGLLAFGFSRAGEIHDAAGLNDLKAVQALLDKQPELVNSRGESQVTPLHEAARYGSVPLVELLIARGADVNARCYNEFTPLHLTDDADIASVLLKHGANLKARDSSSQTPLDDAVDDENLDLIELYLASGERLNFDQLVELGRTKEVAELLKEKPWLAKAPSNCLHAAAARGHLELARVLLDHGADPSLDYGFSNVSGVYSPLSSAVLSNHLEVATLLCERGADVDVAGGKMHDSLFHFAVANRDIRFVRLLLKHGADIHAQNHFRPMTPLHVAANIGGLEKCKLLLEFNADVNEPTPDGATPLFFAAVWNRQAVCELLLSRGAHLDIYSACLLGKGDEVRKLLAANPALANQKDRRLGRTPLFWAAQRGDRQLVELLLDSGADATAQAPSYSEPSNVVTGPEVFGGRNKKEQGETPLHVAAAAGHVEVVRILLDRGAKIDARDEDDRTPLLAAVGSGHVELARLLLARKANPEPVAGESSPLVAASNNLELTKLLLEHRPTQESLDAALKSAANGNVPVAQLLMKHGAKADVYTACTLGLKERVAELIKEQPGLINGVQFDYPRLRPLEIAAGAGHVEVVELLLDRGAEIQNKGQWSPLEFAATEGHARVVKLLLDRGADVDLRDSMGSTPLHAAAGAGHLAVVKLLLEQRADVSVRDVYGKTPLHEAASCGVKECAEMLLAAGAALEARSFFKETPLHEAAQAGDAAMAALFVEKGAEINAKNRRGQTPLACAERELSPDFGLKEPDKSAVIKFLTEHGAMR